MRAEEFVEDNFGTVPKRAARPGARPHRGHEPVPRYRNVKETDSEKIAGRYDPEEFDAMVQRVGQKAKKNPMTGVSPIVQRMRDELAQADKGKDEVKESACPYCGGPAFGDLMLAEKKDACYHKVRSRYKVWPSAYASGALVQCRKKGAANWGNKS
jgi:hypothetical protein